ncbi:4212_t:CDS:2 [Paraglomus occultum]|uniref:4212_t:CDS:1 n=1 Tax=Paraglomus occultum TaxID=144539 RepID=A0A9N9D9D9_9GLOM|nr:4212_t:CDS:2 [Paraglomus occultum]
MFVTKTKPPVKYHPDHIYTFKQFELLNDWLKTNELLIDNTPINHFELDKKGRLIPMLQTPIFKEATVGNIYGQLDRWNVQTRQNGVPTCSQGGFNLSTTGGRTIRAPDVAFTPSETYRNLTHQQLMTFQGQPFHPTFVVEVEDVSADSKLEELKDKFKTVYFPAGVQLGWLVDPVNRNIYVFKEDINGVVRCLNKGWRDVAGGDVLPGFVLEVRLIDEVLSQESSESSSESDGDLTCPKCNEIFDDWHTFLKHCEYEHARKKQKSIADLSKCDKTALRSGPTGTVTKNHATETLRNPSSSATFYEPLEASLKPLVIELFII